MDSGRVMAEGREWPKRRRPEPMDTHRIDLWWISVSAHRHRLDALKNLLTDEERRRADRYLFEKDHDVFVIARGSMRELIGAYLGRDAKGIRFSYGRKGKPSVALPSGGRLDLRFNLSHSKGAILLGVLLGHEIGVDVEYMRPLLDGAGIARRYFSPAECRALAEVSIERQKEAFFNGWTRKEAFIKATGEGLSRPLHSFDVELRPGRPARLMGLRSSASSAEKWEIRDIAPPEEGYRAAFCVEAAPWRVHHYGYE